jgi:hypothetical protein
MRRRIVFVPISMEATLSGKVRSDFTTEFLWDDVGGQFGMKNFKGSPVIKIKRLDGCSRDDANEGLEGELAGNGID